MIRTARALENAADALARLDALLCSPPRAFAIAARARVVGDLSSTGEKGSRAVAIAAAVDWADVPGGVRWWCDFIDEEERRSRGGAPLTMSRLRRAGFPDNAVAHPREAHLGAALAAPGASAERPAALVRALAVAALIDDPAWAEAVAALMLCAEGRIDRVWLLPFATVDGPARAEAIDAWRTGDEARWTGIALEAVATSARSLRNRLERSLATIPAEDERLDALGRAAITARRALALMRDSLVTTVPALSEELAISRPAAGDALERLVTAGLAVELTGRRRGRVFAYAAPLVASA